LGAGRPGQAAPAAAARWLRAAFTGGRARDGGATEVVDRLALAGGTVLARVSARVAPPPAVVGAARHVAHAHPPIERLVDPAATTCVSQAVERSVHAVA